MILSIDTLYLNLVPVLFSNHQMTDFHQFPCLVGNYTLNKHM